MLFTILLFLAFLAILFLWILSLVISVTFGGAPTVYTSRKTIREALKLAGAKKGELITDLGCGNARNLITASKEFGLKGIGIEISPFYYILARINVIIRKENQNIRIYFGDFKRYKKIINKSDLIYVYLFPKINSKIEKFIFNNLKPKARIVSLAFPFPNHKTYKQLKNLALYLYQ